MPLKLIFARAANGVIGRDNALPWHLPEDLAHFKRTTLGCPVIMGRRTWDSLPPRFRPLPGRQNIVLSRNPAWVAEGALRVGSLSEALASLPPEQDVWVIGGAELYAQALPLAQQAVVTEIAQDFEGDAMAPQFGPGWTELSRSDLQQSSTGLTFRFVTYTQEQGA
ncbi:dihydrofolate reductase [Curvibacter sp. RS43]|uniref:dihydrofolate reductase n=1 Tax=Curvibacter microcysteis TaxID=3026419 RepID=UPI00235DDC69|nr:dihydrofolate reductase [Curvibacter sp. RS43]MDD0809151.1 dihydrofolate reductase [Curvibacter sp. RS43]